MSRFEKGWTAFWVCAIVAAINPSALGLKLILLVFAAFLALVEWNTITVPPPLYYYQTVSLTGDAVQVDSLFRVGEEILAVCAFGGGIGGCLAFVLGGLLQP